jgi:hypothetical protein
VKRRGIVTPLWSAPLRVDKRSGCGFARLPDVLILELQWAQIAERRMKPAFVVDLLDEVGKVLGDVFEAFEGHRVDGFDLEGFHEAFRHGVVIRIASTSHRADQLPGLQPFAIRLGSILRAAIGVMDAARRRLSSRDGGLQGRDRQTGVDAHLG